MLNYFWPTCKLAKTIKEGKRGIVEEILAYDSKNDRYKVRYDEGTEEYITPFHQPPTSATATD